MLGKSTAVVFDLDSTLAWTKHRHHLAPDTSDSTDARWAAYSLACVDDEPMAGPIALTRLLWGSHEIHICSGRMAAARDQTVRWLDDHNVAYDSLNLRRAGDARTNVRLKTDFIEAIRSEGREVVLMVEDWVEGARAIESQLNVPVIFVNPAYEENSVVYSQRKVDHIGGGL
jgi:hypothetical protein